VTSRPATTAPLPTVLLLVVALGGCTIGDSGEATSGSPSAEATEEVMALRQRASRLESMSIELEEQASAARELADPAARAAAAADIAERVAALVRENEALQAEFTALDQRLHATAGDPVAPQD